MGETSFVYINLKQGDRDEPNLLHRTPIVQGNNYLFLGRKSQPEIRGDVSLFLLLCIYF